MITISDKAAQRIRAIFEREESFWNNRKKSPPWDRKEMGIRIVRGYYGDLKSYSLIIEPRPQDGDITLESNGIIIFAKKDAPMPGDFLIDFEIKEHNSERFILVPVNAHSF